MEVNKKQDGTEYFDWSMIGFNALRNPVVIKEIFPNGPIGSMLLDSTYNVVQIDDAILHRMGYKNMEDLMGQSFFCLFSANEKARLSYFFKQAHVDELYSLSHLRPKVTDKNQKWISLYAKKKKMNNNKLGYHIVFLDERHSYVTVGKDNFDTLHHSILAMHESELAYLGVILRDDIAQELYALRVSMQNFIINYGYESEISVFKKRLNDTIKKITDLSNDLRPNVYENGGFTAAMEDMVFALKRRGSNFKYKFDKKISDKSPDFQLCCYRVVQSLLRHWKQKLLPFQALLTITVTGNRVNIDLTESRNVESEVSTDYSEKLMHNIRNRISRYEGVVEVNNTSEHNIVLVTMYN